MDQQHDESGHESVGFVPDAYDRQAARTKADAISPLRRHWRVPAVVATLSAAAALCLYDGSGYAAHTTASANIAADTPAKPKPAAHFENAADTPDHGGVHGAFNIYDGLGGAIEFWFDPSTGNLTIADGIGVGAGGGGVLGTYKPGTAPEPGTYVYANADLSAGSVATVNVGGTYSLDADKFVGTVSTTVEGRTLTLASDGGASVDVSFVAAAGAEGYSGAVGVEDVWKFNAYNVTEYIWDSITSAFTGHYSLQNSDTDATDDTTLFDDDTDTDDDSDLTTTTTDDSTDASSDDDSSTDDSSSDDAVDDSTDDGVSDDGGDGGCAVNLHELADTQASAPNRVAPDEIAPVDSDGDGDGC